MRMAEITGWLEWFVREKLNPVSVVVMLISQKVTVLNVGDPSGKIQRNPVLVYWGM